MPSKPCTEYVVAHRFGQYRVYRSDQHHAGQILGIYSATVPGQVPAEARDHAARLNWEAREAKAAELARIRVLLRECPECRAPVRGDSCRCSRWRVSGRVVKRKPLFRAGEWEEVKGL